MRVRKGSTIDAPGMLLKMRAACQSTRTGGRANAQDGDATRRTPQGADNGTRCNAPLSDNAAREPPQADGPPRRGRPSLRTWPTVAMGAGGRLAPCRAESADGAAARPGP